MKGEYDKAAIREYVKDQINGKIKTLNFYLAFTQDASKDLKKTEKYDSIREEIHEELYHLHKQMHSLRSMQKQMQKVISSPTSIIQVGSLVITNKARFYISVSYGEFFFEDLRYYAISLESPMAQILVGKQIGDEFILNKIHQRIEMIL